MSNRPSKIKFPHQGEMAEAQGTLEVCLLTLMVIAHTRTAQLVVIAVIAWTGIVSTDALSAIMEWMSGVDQSSN